ncbi:hypothetical protein MNV49_003488 [Pseudohyphozyma bogoriensis]|nr:hypothetical protein MNV49_003488 [Pseudohyphozyma bogoriensis]
MPRTPTTNGNGTSPAPPPAPSLSPSLSPSINSLLNPTSHSSVSSSNDYFSQDPTRSPSLVFAPDDEREPSPPRSSRGGFAHLLAPDPQFSHSPSEEQPVSEDRPKSAKRPRTSTPPAVPSPAAVPPPPATAEATPPPPVPQLVAGAPILEPSIFLVDPIDEFTREVADWLWGFCSQVDWEVLEIEAKIGILIDTRMRGKERYHLPVPIETILTDDTGLRFESNMTVNQHKGFNQLLNSRVEESASPSYTYAPIRYSHTYETDTFHEVSGQGPRRKVRLTKNQKDPKLSRCVEKTRIADMNIFSPKRMFDWRISVNLEQPAPAPTTPPVNTRQKDRISYSHQLFQVDLTQVTSSHGGGNTLHELEVEFKDAKVLMREGEKDARGEPNAYLEMVQAFLNNIRLLIRNAADP